MPLPRKPASGEHKQILTPQISISATPRSSHPVKRVVTRKTVEVRQVPFSPDKAYSFIISARRMFGSRRI